MTANRTRKGAQERIRWRASLRMHTTRSDVESVPLEDVSTTEALLALVDGTAVHRSKHL
ncbi:MAG: hypothetical protein ACXWDU_06940 [Actinomycetota bacterium]